MNKNNPINSVYLIALACASLITVVGSLYEALVFSVVVIVVFLISISIVSMIEKIADKHVKFITFALISAALITVLKVVFEYVNLKLIVVLAETIDFAILPCLLIGIVPIYFEDALSVKEYFSTAFLMCITCLLMFGLYGAIHEILAYGKIANVSLGFEGYMFFRMSYGSLIIIATLAIIFNICRRAYLKNSRKFNMLVEKYKIQIREIRDTEEKMKKEQKGGKQ